MVNRFFILLFLIHFHTSVFSQNPVLYNGTGASIQDKIIAHTLAGIVNRDSARLFLLNVYETWSYNRTDETWRDLYRSRGGVVYDSVQSMSALINKFRYKINGAITYDAARYYSNFSGQNFCWQAEAAALIGSLTDRLPVISSYAATLGLQVSDSVFITDAFDGDSSIWVTGRVEAVSNPWNQAGLTEEQRYFFYLDWGINRLLPRCNPDMFYIREYTDWASKNRMFQLNLAGTEDLNFNSLSTGKADLIERVLLFLQNKNPNRIFHIYGWMRPEPLTQWFAHFGASFHETLLGNLSWHSAFPVSGRSYTRASIVDPDTLQLQNKYYLIFITSEGDACNWVYGLQSGGWLSAYRGYPPVAWGWNLHMLSLTPFVAKYYSETATKNDGFISVTSPLGYAFPDLWNATVRPNAVSASKALMDSFNVYTVYGYKHYASSGSVNYRGKQISNSFDFPKFGQFQKDIGAHLTFLFDPLLATQTPTTFFGSLLFNHVNDNTFYSDVSNLNTTATRIVNALTGKQKPYFYLAGYQRMRQDDFTGRSSPGNSDISVQRLNQLIGFIKSDPTIGADIEVVTPEVFSVLLRKKLGLSEVDYTENIKEFVTLENYPNPFSSKTTIRFSCPVNDNNNVSLKVFDILGKEVADLSNRINGPGLQEIVFPDEGVSNIPSGIYFYRLITGKEQYTKKMILVR
ncbi:MAG: T9SS type A sorting domain-containing protein [Ignavibacteriaceae bacterium]|nr:T9SS type A sorting domain-containing protein [Ignavibacteriaceae bacterium]